MNLFIIIKKIPYFIKNKILKILNNKTIKLNKYKKKIKY